MNLQEIQGRLRVLFPKANLSKERISQYAEKLIKKLTEESTQEDLDGLLTDLNDMVNFEQVAKQDDQLRTLLNTKPKTETELPKTIVVEDSKNETDKLLEAIANLTSKVQGLETQKIEETIQSKFRNHEALKGVPAEFLDLVKSPQTLDEVDVFANSLADAFKDKQIKSKLDAFGSDIPKQGEHSNSAVKEASDDEVKDLMKDLKF